MQTHRGCCWDMVSHSPPGHSPWEEPIDIACWLSSLAQSVECQHIELSVVGSRPVGVLTISLISVAFCPYTTLFNGSFFMCGQNLVFMGCSLNVPLFSPPFSCFFPSFSSPYALSSLHITLPIPPSFPSSVPV